MLIQKIMGVEVPKDKMDGALEDLEGSLKLTEEKFLEVKPFITGEQISLADMVAIVQIMQGSGGDREELFNEAHQWILTSKEMVKNMDGSKMQVFKPKILILFF
ncbi:unnamed protein product [Coregonus sp. 'balchen']|nr:unnamed protein product [Coregonus sp. 'balchen']